MLSFAVLGFMVVYREGFETILFYQALMIDGDPAPVWAGFAAGLMGILLFSYGFFWIGARLPIKTFFTITGVVLMIMALAFIGMGIRGLQTAGIIGATPVAGFPESTFLQLYLGMHPVAATLTIQGALILLFLGGWVWYRCLPHRSRGPKT